MRQRLDPHAALRSRETEGEGQPSRALLESQLSAVEERLREVGELEPATRLILLLERARLLLGLERNAEAWSPAREALDVALAAEHWEQAAEACEAMYLSEQPESIAALGQGVWLAVTYPIDPELSVEMLQHVVDETPDDADGAAVAAATAHYLVDLRTQGKQRENLNFFTARMLSDVARRHSKVNEQSEFDAWMRRLELDDPEKFLVRLRNVVDVLVQDQWWFDRDALRERLPVN